MAQVIQCDQCGKIIARSDLRIHVDLELRVSTGYGNEGEGTVDADFCSAKCAQEWFAAQLVKFGGGQR